MEGLREHFVQLRTEDAIFERMMYKNKSQHRACLYFRKLKQVQRSLRLLKMVATDEALASLDRYFQRRGKRQKSDGKDVLLNCLLGIARITEEMSLPILGASKHLMELLKQCFFTSFALTMLAMLARLRALTQQILLDAVPLYNSIAAVFFDKASLQPFSKLQKGLPAAIDCKWEGVQYRLQETKAYETWFVNDRRSIEQQATARTQAILDEQTPVQQASEKLNVDEPRTDLSSTEAATTSTKRTAYVSVKTSTVKVTPGAKTDETPSFGPRLDDVFNLLLAGRDNQSLF